MTYLSGYAVRIREIRNLAKIKKIEKSLQFLCFWSDFFAVKKKNVIWDISDGLERFWDQKSFSSIFKIACYVKTGFSTSILASKTSEIWRQDIFFGSKITKISKSSLYVL